MSAVDLLEVARVCTQLSGKGVTERRDASGALRKLLNLSKTQRFIDENTDSKRKNCLTWDQIFFKAKEYVVGEIGYMVDQVNKKPNKSLSATTLSTRKKRFEDASSFIKFIVRTANARSPRLKVQEVLGHIMYILSDASMCMHLGTSYCDMLFKCVLAVPVYRIEIPHQQWEELLELFVMIVEDPPAWAPKDQGMMIRVLHKLYTDSPVHLNKPIHFKFFTKLFKDVRQGMSVPCIESLLDSLTSFALSVAEDCRGQVCLLGESIFAELLNLWRKQGMPYRDHLVPFLQLQMSIHNPCGTHTDIEGACSSDVTHWKKCTQKLYEAILFYVNQLGTRIRGPGAKLDPHLKPGFLDLAADVLHQVLWSKSSCHSIDVGDRAKNTGSSAKKRRIDIGWHVVRDTLESCHEGPVMLAWLQMLAALFHKHPSCIPSQEMLPIITSLHQIQSNCKRQETTGNILKCLESFASCFAKRRSPNNIFSDAMGVLWSKVWTTVLKTIGSKHHREQGYSLLTTLVMEKLAPLDLDSWKVLCSGPPSRCSMEFLSASIQAHPLPEGFTPLESLFLSSAESGHGRFPLRRQLFDWFLPVSVDGSELSKGLGAVLCSKTQISMKQVAEVLTSLTQRFPNMSSFTEHADKIII